MIGKGVFAKYLSDATIVDNVIINGKNIPKSDIYVPPRNALVDTFNSVGFIGWQSGNYRLAPNSKFKGKGANGKDFGCDFDALENEIKGKR